MDQNLPEEPVEAHVVVQYDRDCPTESFLSYRTVDGRAVLVITFGDIIPKHSALMQARAMVAPYSAEAAKERAAHVRAQRDAEGIS